MSAVNKILHGKNSVKGATGLLIITLTISNVLGLFRDRFLAAKIPASELDSYYAAFRLPDLLTNLIVIGAIAVVFIPVFTEIRTKDEEKAWDAASAILNIMVSLLIVGALFLFIFMPQLMPLVVPEFDTDKLNQTIALSRWLTLTPILFGISYLLSGVLNSFQRFTVYSLAPLVYNLSIIVATVALADRFGVAGVVGGVIVGSALHMLIQLPVALRLGWHWRPLFTISHPAVKRVAALMVPRTVGLLAMQLVTIVATAIGSAWAGAITYYNLANNIQTMPSVVFANSIATAIFPTISAAAAKENQEDFRRHIVQGIRWILFLLIPASIGLILLRIQVIRLVLGAGFFGWEATQTTADVLGWFAISIVASGLIPLLARAFYARQDMQTPMNIALASASTTIALSFVLPKILPPTVQIGASYLLHTGEVAALAIALSTGTILNAGLLLRAIGDRMSIGLGEVTRSVGKILVATLLMAVIVQLSKTVIGANLDLSRSANVLIQTLVPILLGAGTYAIAVWQLGCAEWHELLSHVKRKTSSTTKSTQPA